MYTVNITFKVEHPQFESWKEWMNKEFSNEFFSACKPVFRQLHQLLGHDDVHGTTAVLQIGFDSEELLGNYLTLCQGVMAEKIVERWGETVLFFQTILKKV